MITTLRYTAEVERSGNGHWRGQRSLDWSRSDSEQILIQRSAFGVITARQSDCFVRKMRGDRVDKITPGYVHIDEPRLQPLCRKLGIPYRRAMIGWSAGGRWPQYSGVIIQAHLEAELRAEIESRTKRTNRRKLNSN